MFNHPRSPVATVVAACLFFVPAHGRIFELPRSTATMPVQALVTCNSSRCEFAEHCARYDRWQGIVDSDFRNEWLLESGQAVMTPKRASHNLLCAISFREGQTSVRPIRYLRERDATGAWRYVSAARDWGLREMSAPESPETEDDFYALVSGKKLCLDGCTAESEYVYFDSARFSGNRFSHFAPGVGVAEGRWEYQRSTRNIGSVTFAYNVGHNCWMTMDFETDTSGTYDATCNDEDNTTGSGPWIITSR